MIDKEFKKERHEIYVEKLYKFADLPRLEFEAKVEIFKSQYPDLWDEKKDNPHFSKYQLKSFIKDYKW